MKWLDYTFLSFRRVESLRPGERRDLAELSAEDERLGDRIAPFEIPAVLAIGAMALVIGGVVLLSLW